MAKFDKKLASILAKTGLVAEEQCVGVLAAAEEGHKSLTAYLLDQKIATEADIIGAVSMEMNLPPIDIDRIEIDAEALSLVPEGDARRFQVIPVARIGKTLTLAVANPTDVLTQDNLNLITGCELMPVVSTDVSINRAIAKAYGNGQEVAEVAEVEMEDLVSEMGLEDSMELAEDVDEEVDVTSETAQSEAAPVVKLVNTMIVQAVKAGASDIHIEPSEKKVRVRYRIDGVCSEKLFPPKRMHNAVASRIKLMTESMDIAERQKPQDGKIKLRFKDREIDFRVSVLPLIFGEKIVMRVLDTTGVGKDLDSLGFEAKALKDFSNAIGAANGLVLVTGPTGSGKSTTLYSAIKKIIRIEDNITTVEDPVEYSMDGVNQCQVNTEAGLTFSTALRAILRQDPDILLIGEIRDKETAEIAVKAALTGHVVFSTLHTNDAPTTITRLVDMGIDTFLVATCVNLVSAQRLVRRLCTECRESYKATEQDMLKWGFTEEEAAAEPNLFRPKGCGRCGDLGYKGRLPLLETLPLNEELREIIVKGASADAIKKVGLSQGMITLRRVGIINVIQGNTGLEEVLSITMPDR